MEANHLILVNYLCKQNEGLELEVIPEEFLFAVELQTHLKHFKIKLNLLLLQHQVRQLILVMRQVILVRLITIVQVIQFEVFIIIQEQQMVEQKKIFLNLLR